MRADLHIHTTASDGTWDPVQLVRELKREGIGAFAVTDHDSTDNVAEAAALAQAEGLVFLPGVELNSTKNGHNYHILGYGVDIDAPALKELCAYNSALLLKKDDDSIRILEEEGWPVSLEEFRHYSYDRHRGGWGSLAYLEDKGLCKGVGDFFGRIFTSEHNLGFPDFPSVREVISVIHQAGGAAICAHLASDFHGPGLSACLPQMMEEKPDGFECYHSNHSEENSRLLAGHCRKNGLMISGGSDCHGLFVPSRHLGIPRINAEDLHLPGILKISRTDITIWEAVLNLPQ